MLYKTLFFITLVLGIVSARADVSKFRIADFRIPKSQVFSLSAYARVERYNYALLDDLTRDLFLLSYFHILDDTTEFLLDSRIGGYWYKLEEYEGSFYSLYCAVGPEVRYYVHSPLFLHGKAGLSVLYRKSAGGQGAAMDDTRGGFEVGGGIGHLRPGHAAAIAIYVNEMLLREKVIESDLAPETIQRLAELVSTRGFFQQKYARYQKYFFEEIERILVADPACTKPLGAFMWFKIFEILPVTNYLSSRGYNHWLRMFGSRLSIDLIADDISRPNYTVYTYARLGFPFGETYYYTPGVRIRLERGYPIDLRRQLTLSSTYQASWYDSVLLHRVEAQCRYGYGIIDFLLIEGLLSVYYDYHVPRDTSSMSMYGIQPEFVFTYYLEDNISIILNGGCFLRKEYNPVPEINDDRTVDWFVTFSTRWQVF